MMQQLTKGEKRKLADIGCAGPFTLGVGLAHPTMTVDVACFGLDAQGKLSDERYMVFYNQTSDPERAIVLEADAGGKPRFALDPVRLPGRIERLVFAASIDGAGRMRDLGQSELRIGDAVHAFSGRDFDSERALILAEVYRHGGEWRLGVVGQGFAGGLAALLAHFGGTEAAPEAPAASAVPAAPAAAPPAPPVAAPVRLSKVTLTKPGEGHAISLAKQSHAGAAAPKALVVTATWQDNGDASDANDDLDLRAGLLLPDGRMHIISAPKSPGAFDASPFVHHQGDVRVASRTAHGCETILVNPAIARRLGGRVALVFSVYSAISNGLVQVASLRPRMRMEYGDQVVECAFDFESNEAAKQKGVYTYVLGTAVIDEDSVVLAPSGQTSSPASEHTPWLHWQGSGVSVTMNGPAVVKSGGFLVNLITRSPHKYS